MFAILLALSLDTLFIDILAILLAIVTSSVDTDETLISIEDVLSMFLLRHPLEAYGT